MNTVTIKMADGTDNIVPVQQLAVEGMRISISANGREALKKMSDNSVHVEARNDANSLLWLATFGPVLFSILAQHEAASNIAMQKAAAEKEAGNEEASQAVN
jgi:succinate dehydrogenase/fumarate reductase flavoprotein subunit